MRITSIQIGQWRHFSGVELTLPDDVKLVCVVGANGTGKSHLLELVAACAHRLGLSPGLEASRGNPFEDSHCFTLQFHLAPGASDRVDKRLSSLAGFADWNRTLTLTSRKVEAGVSDILAGGIKDKRASADFAAQVVVALNQSDDVHFLFLDADRAYPKKEVNVNELGKAYGTDWGGTQHKRGRSYRRSTTLYDEWHKYFLARENQAGTGLVRDIRRARVAGAPEPEFVDHFSSYRESIRKVLRHVEFAGVDSAKRKLLFDTTGLELSFDELSGGEREIAFLLGQIDRFGLRNGLFLLDEPELHLNADLIRSWVTYLASTVETGQIWLATHSLEAVEAAGQQSTFVLERDEDTRKVTSATRLDKRPVLSSLSRAVGTPAFSISSLLFVFVEGEESIGERERFRRLAGMREDVRFMECGSCDQVMKRVGVIRHLAKEAESEIRIAGVIDRDFRSEADAKAMVENHGIFVLPVHEVENFFLHPATLDVLLAQNGRTDYTAEELILNASDARAGSWIFQNALASRNAMGLSDLPALFKERVKRMTWPEFAKDRAEAISALTRGAGIGEDTQKLLSKILDISARRYERKRHEATLWKVCEGKQVLNSVAREVGFPSSEGLCSAAFVAWSRNATKLPAELKAFRRYLENQ